MTRTLTVKNPEDIEQALQDQTVRSGASREQIVVAWLRQHVPPTERGTVDAIMPLFGAWSMSDEERQHLEQMIDEELLMEDEQFEIGTGDYTRDRHQWLPDDLQEIFDEIERQRGGSPQPRAELR